MLAALKDMMIHLFLSSLKTDMLDFFCVCVRVCQMLAEQNKSFWQKISSLLVKGIIFALFRQLQDASTVDYRETDMNTCCS